MAMAARDQRRFVTLRAHPFRAKPVLELAPDLRQALGGSCLEPQYEHWLRIRCPDKAPSIAKEHACAIHVNDVARLAEVTHGALDDAELDVVCALHAELRRGHVLRHIGEQRRDAPPGIGHDAKESRRTVECIVVPVR